MTNLNYSYLFFWPYAAKVSTPWIMISEWSLIIVGLGTIHNWLPLWDLLEWHQMFTVLAFRLFSNIPQVMLTNCFLALIVLDFDRLLKLFEVWYFYFATVLWSLCFCLFIFYLNRKASPICSMLLVITLSVLLMEAIVLISPL